MRVESPVPLPQLSAIRAPFLDARPETVDTPILQPLGLLLELAGEALRARLFVVQAQGGEEACLRPDFTVPVARLHLDRGSTAGSYYYEGKVFRAAPEAADRPEEFLQIGLERFASGEVSAQADVDIVALAWRAVAAGGRKDLSLWLGDVALFSAFISGLDLSPSLSARLIRAAGRPRLLQAELARAGQDVGPVEGDGLASLLASLPPAEAGRMLEDVWALAGIDPVGGRGPAEIAQRLIRRAEAAKAPNLSGDQAEAIGKFLAVDASPLEALEIIAKLGGPKSKALLAGLEVWRGRIAGLQTEGLPIQSARFLTALGHTFDYYDGLTFEIRSARLGPDFPIAVGGRYDGLLTRLGGPADARAVGCMVRPGRAIAECLV